MTPRWDECAVSENRGGGCGWGWRFGWIGSEREVVRQWADGWDGEGGLCVLYVCVWRGVKVRQGCMGLEREAGGVWMGRRMVQGSGA